MDRVAGIGIKGKQCSSGNFFAKVEWVVFLLTGARGK